MRLFWIALGWSALGLGFLGAVLPIMPTVPFMLLAAYAFSKSSERFHAWLLGHPVFGQQIMDWTERGAIGLPAKRLATISFFGSIGIGLLLGLPHWIVACQAIALTASAAFIWTRPNA